MGEFDVTVVAVSWELASNPIQSCSSAERGFGPRHERGGSDHTWPMVLYQALGPVEVLDDDGPLSLGGSNQRRLIAVLLAQLGQEVTVWRLADSLWLTRAPASAHHAVQTVVSRTRRALGESREEIVTTSEGYRLVTQNCDIVRFEALLNRAKATAPNDSIDLLEEALALWKGEAFGVLSEIEVVRVEAIRLNELRLLAMEDRFQLLVDGGRHKGVVPELEAFVALEPMRERARGFLMQALYWSGRQPEALAVFADYRNLLGEGLGLEPSAALKDLEESIVLDSLEEPGDAAGHGVRFHGRVGADIAAGPEATALESLGWDRLWDHDHEGSVEARQHAYVRLLQGGDRVAAARLAIWLGVNAAVRLKNPVAFGWLSRAQQLLEGEPPGPSHGLLAALIGMVEILGGDVDAAMEHGTSAQQIGVESGDRDVEALGKTVRGWAMVRLGDTKAGMGLMDAAMASAIAGELGAYVSALVYCRTLCACIDLMDYGRAAEWTEEIMRVRDSGGMSDLPGDCRTHRLSIFLFRGDWAEGEREAVAACAETETFDLTHLALAKALRGEILVRRGDLDAGEVELLEAQAMGASPYPALAQIELARGAPAAAAKMIKDAAAEVGHDPLPHARLLPAVVEIALADHDEETAHAAAATMSEIADRFGTSALQAAARHAEGLVRLGRGEYGLAVRTLRNAWRRWDRIGSRYDAAKARLALARALSGSGRYRDSEVEATAARAGFAELGASLDVARADDFLTTEEA